MITPHPDPQLLKLSILADGRVSEMSKLMEPLWTAGSIDDKKAKILVTLSTACISTSGSALNLIEIGRVWDAAILQRSVMEGTVRFIYLLQGEGDLDDKFDEFSSALEDIAWLRLTRKVHSFLDALGDRKLDEGSQKTLESMVLHASEIEQLSEKYNKRDRRQIENKWSFGKLLQNLVSADILPVQVAADFQLRYLKSSQSIHGNPLGLASFYERAHRVEPNRSWATYAHAAEIAKILRDLCLYRLYATHVFLKSDMKPLLAAYADCDFDAHCANIFERHHNLEYGDE